MRGRFLSALAVVMLAAGCVGPIQGQQSGSPIIIPKTAPAPETAPPPAPPPAPEPKPQYSYTVNIPEIQIPVTVQTADGDFIPNLTKDQFQLSEDGVPQTLSKVAMTDSAPITVVMLVEFRNIYAPFIIETLQASYLFTGQLQPKDWVALVSYDMKDNIVVDFTQNKQDIYAGLNTLRFPVFTTADLWDSVADTVDRLDSASIKGRKIVLLISTGFNTFSHMTYDELRKRLAEEQNVSIYAISTGWALEQRLGAAGSMQQLDLMQAGNELRAMADITGGRYYEPRFEGAFPDVFRDISQAVRSEYILSYVPTNKKLDGTQRKIKVTVVGPNGQPLRILDQKGKVVKYTVDYRNTYTAKHIVE